jgi:PPK2 family polyphosphate:nucleotide phosphotransferase
MKAKRKLSLDALIRLADRCTVTDGRKFRIDKVKTDDTMGLSASKDEAEALLKEAVEKIATQQETLYAQNEWGVLLIFQAMDAAGKDSAIEHVFSGVNPQGVQVHSFEAPSAEELDHDFLWRTAVRLPERGRIGVFNRSYYEEVLVVRVHPELLRSQRLPPPVATTQIWAERFEDINAFERHLVRSGYLIRKFFLHVSQEEQGRRFLKRLEEPEKRWKFSLGDIRDRERWDDYMKAYQAAIRSTTTSDAPWIVVPADRKWFARLVIAGAILGALKGLDLHSPSVDPSHEQELNAIRETLLAQVSPSGARRKTGAKRR